MGRFELVSDFQPTGDQPQAIAKLVEGLRRGYRMQTLLGATGTGKSLAGEEPIFVWQKENGRWVPRLLPIGELVDGWVETRPDVKQVKDTWVASISPEDSPYRVVSFDPARGIAELKPVTALIRHQAPTRMYRVSTACGRRALITGDHNLWVLRDGQICLLPTSDVRPGDYLPLPRHLPGPPDEMVALDLVSFLSSENVYVEANSLLSEVIATDGYREMAKELSEYYRAADAKLSAILHNRRGSRIPIRIFHALLEKTQNLHGRWDPTRARIVGKVDRCSLPALLPVSDELLRLIGYYLAEGNNQEQSGYLIWSNYDPQVREDFEAVLTSLGLPFTNRKNTDYQVSSTPLALLLKHLAGSTAADKHLPSFWPQLSDRQLGLLLRAYLDGDGYVEKSNAVCCITASRRLACDLAYALLRFGIWARIRQVWKRATNSSHQGNRYWMVTISGQENRRKFQVFLFERGRRNPRPRTQEKVLDALREVAERQNIQDTWWEEWESLQSLTGVRWTPVQSVEQVVYNHPFVYDVSVADNETFLAGEGGIFLHNTYVMAQVIAQSQRPTLVLAPNKTLAAQLYSEFREFFPKNAVEYFVSYYDYYQPEAYVPAQDLYIEKDADINAEIEKLRLAATEALLTRRDVIIVASVSCIYSIGSPEEYGRDVVVVRRGELRRRDSLLRHLAAIYYDRNDLDFRRGTFRVRGDTVDVFPAYRDTALRIEFWGDEVERLAEIDPLTGEILDEPEEVRIFPARHFITRREQLEAALRSIEEELEERLKELREQGKLLEAQRLEQRTRYDIEMMRETGYCAGIENYSRHLSMRKPGQAPWTLLDYFPDDFLLFIDESHIAIPQLHGMYNGDRSRKETLVEYGFRLPSALDNRPLTFEEFEERIRQVICFSATPGPYELEHSEQVVEQIIRPTGLVDPWVEVRPTQGQIDDLLEEIGRRVAKGQRALVTTLTKRMAEDLADYLREMGIKTHYLHSEIETIERVEILRDLRLGVYDVVVGINLLREGLDLPEVSLVAILDADKEGFLRSTTSLIQTIGRAARHVEGTVIMYADTVTPSMAAAIAETNRRRQIQMAYNQAHGIVPQSIVKEVRDLTDRVRRVAEERVPYGLPAIPQDEARRLMRELERQMREAARKLEFEKAALLRDRLFELRALVEEDPVEARLKGKGVPLRQELAMREGDEGKARRQGGKETRRQGDKVKEDGVI